MLNALNLPITASDVESAAQVVAPAVHQTPLELSQRLTDLAGMQIYLKREDLQTCRSFKVRGAYNKISRLSKAERVAGVICASAGNHAQGVAYTCAQLGIQGTIFLPESTPNQKQGRIRSLGGKWVTLEFVEGAFDDTQRAALRRVQETGCTYVHPYDDPQVMAGQGSLAYQMATQIPDDTENILIPVGGGGLISGMVVWLKQHFPKIRIIGVESEGAACAYQALLAGGPQTLPQVDSFVDGTAVGRIGDNTYKVISELVDQVVVVPEGAVCTEMLDLYHLDGIIAEPAGALATTAITMAAQERLPELSLSGPTIAVISGGNNDLSRYAEVMERSMVYQGLRHYFLVSFPQRPGALRHFLENVLGPHDDIISFEYVKKNNRETGPALVGIDIQRQTDLPPLLKRIEKSSLKIERLDLQDELLRFLV